MINYEEQFLTIADKVMTEGVWVNNERTGTRVLTIIGETMKFYAGENHAPLFTGRQSFPVSAVAEIVGYLRKYTNAQDFADIGSPTWFTNANETQAWLDNPYRKGEDDMGLVYGAAMLEGELEGIYDDLRRGVDNRGETLNFWRPEMFDKGCLRPCMRMHTFSLLGGVLHLTSESRSVDVACGLNFNSIQCYFLLNFMAKITGHKVGNVTHNLINVHIYEEHIDGMKEQLARTPQMIYTEFKMSDDLRYLHDVTNTKCHAREFFTLEGYKGNHRPKIPFKLIA